MTFDIREVRRLLNTTFMDVDEEVQRLSEVAQVPVNYVLVVQWLQRECPNVPAVFDKDAEPPLQYDEGAYAQLRERESEAWVLGLSDEHVFKQAQNDYQGECARAALGVQRRLKVANLRRQLDALPESLVAMRGGLLASIRSEEFFADTYPQARPDAPRDVVAQRAHMLDEATQFRVRLEAKAVRERADLAAVLPRFQAFLRELKSEHW